MKTKTYSLLIAPLLRKSLLSLCVFSAASSISFVANADSLLIKNGQVHTLGAQGVLKNADIFINDGMIQKVGTNISENADRTIDASGKIVTPGVFAVANQLGLVEIDALDQTGDMQTEDEDLGAAFTVHQVFNPNSTLIAHNRANGVTRTLIAPYAGSSLFAGKGAIMSLKGSDNGSLIRKEVAMFALYGESGANMSGGSRASALHQLQKAIDEAKEYSDNQEAIESGEYRELYHSLEDLIALQAVVAKEMPLVISVNRESDIIAMVKFAKQNDLRLVIAGAAEAWKQASLLAQEEVAVMVDPTDNIPDSFESLGKRFENAALLHKAGVDVVFLGQSFQSTHNAHVVRQSAGNAVAYGMPYEAALKAFTVTPARIFGGASNYGKIIPGYKAELVVWDGDPLEVTSMADQVIIDGQVTDMTTRAKRLRDRYKDIKDEKNTHYRK
ncbi:MAG: amidohydrolase family protein [Kangiellaceae bacterium]|nr:amidohydrolase family protein [Kangiellaceae bacterium]